MKNRILLLTSLLFLIFSSCKNIEQNTSRSGTTTVTFAAAGARSIYAEHSASDYNYTISGTSGSGATFAKKMYTYTELSSARFEIQQGTWDFTMNAYADDCAAGEPVFSGTKTVTLTDEPASISIPLHAVTGSTASLSVKLNFPKDKGVAKITAALYDTVTEADAGSALTLEAGSVTFTNDDVPAATSKILKFYLYDCQDVCIASYIEGVYLAAQDNVSVERTLSNVNMFAATVSVEDANGNALTDSGLLVKAVQDDKKYPMTAVSGTNMYTASLPVGTYDVYTGQTDTGSDLTISFINGGTTSFQFNYPVCTPENLYQITGSLTEDSTIVLTGQLTESDLSSIRYGLEYSEYNVNLDLSQTTGLTSIPDTGFTYLEKLSGIVIPESVTSIGPYAFYECTSLSSVTIPDSVSSIGEAAFFECDSLSSVTIGDSVTSIGNAAFEGCSSLSSITIGDSVTSIGTYAFEGCASLSSISIPESVTTIDTGAFAGCTNLTAFTVDSNNANYSSIDGVLFNKDASTLITYPAGKQSVTYTIPDSVTSIGAHAFEDCTSLSSVTIPDSVTAIGGCAFYECSSLSSVTIPDSVTTIDVSAFSHCTSLSSVTIGNSVTAIGDCAFYECSSLSSVTIPDSVTTIGQSVFFSCINLTAFTVDSNNANYSSIDGVLFNKDASTLINYPAGKQSAAYTIPDSVTAIGDYAFYRCSSLSSVTIPNSVTYIDGWAFKSCSSLSSVIIPDSVTYVGYSSFENCPSLSSVTIGNSVTYIGDDAFRTCTSLSSVTIPESVTAIGDYVFNGCTALTSITFADTTTWYTVRGSDNWNNKTGGAETDVSDAAANATYFKDTYKSYYWYKLDE